MKLVKVLLFLLYLFVIISFGSFSSAAGCSNQKPAYMDEIGIMHMNYCFGPDKLVGTEDDCGCPRGKYCQRDGSCKIVCVDGTLIEECSDSKKGYLCNSEGILLLDSICSESVSKGSSTIFIKKTLPYFVILLILVTILILTYLIFRIFWKRKSQDNNLIGEVDGKI